MAYTSADLAAVQKAKVDRATGKQVLSVTLPSKGIQYANPSDEFLNQLESQIKGDLAAAEGRGSFFLVHSSKGL
jgi:hypothetical protein